MSRVDGVFTRHHRCDPTRVYVVVRTPSTRCDRDAPRRPKEVTVGKTVLVDRIDLVGCKVPAKVVDRWVHKDRSHRFTVMFSDGERRFKVPRDEMIVQEHKYFYWNCLTAQTCWEPPDANRKVLWNMFRGRSVTQSKK